MKSLLHWRWQYMYVTRPGTGERVWVPITDSGATKLKAGLGCADLAILAAIAGLVLTGLACLLDFVVAPNKDGGAGVLLAAGALVALGLAMRLGQIGRKAKQKLETQLQTFHVLSTGSMVYRLMAAQLLVRSGRDLTDLLTDKDDVERYERIVSNFVRMSDVAAVVKSYDEAIRQKDRAAQMVAHAALVSKIDGVVEDLNEAYRSQHQ